MRTCRMTVAYDGTEYAGFQIQPGRRTIQETLEDAIGRVTGERIRVAGAGRTDAGVHAVGQVISFRLDSRLELSELRRAVNAVLPEDLSIVGADEATGDFHARYSARGRCYRYTIWNAPERNVFERRYSLHWNSRLDDAAMDEAAQLLVGRRDFAAFSGTLRGRERPTTSVRTLWRLRCRREDRKVFVDAAADAFLPHMVRNIVGTLLQVGTQKLAVTGVVEILNGRDRQKAGNTAAAHGLCLTKVLYEGMSTDA
jgi:tRNA pseudouridine38-40 synthase